MSHYSTDYFNWQKSVGEFGGIANLVKFQEFVTAESKVVDFGCGGGFLLSNLKCKEKIGVEINPEAAESAKARGLRIVASLDQIDENWANVIVSNHALEHVPDPLGEVRRCVRVLEGGGYAVFVVPLETKWYKYVANDINRHLYTWSPMNLGNLFHEGGFEIIDSKVFFHKWPPYRRQITKYLGWSCFHLLSRFYAHFDRRDFQVRVVARKPS